MANSQASSTVLTVGVYQRSDGPSLIAGGSFATIGGLASSHWGELSCADVFLFTDGFESGDLSAWTTSNP